MTDDVEMSSGNVFEDLGLPNAVELLSASYIGILEQKLTSLQTRLDSAVEALKRITLGGKVAAYNSHTDTELVTKLLDETVGVARAALASIGEEGGYEYKNKDSK